MRPHVSMSLPDPTTNRAGTRSRGISCLGLVLAALAASGVAVGVAHAQSTSADQLVTDGLAARRAGHDDEALTLFTRAWDVGHSPRARAQMGLAEQALGRFVEAEQHLQEALASAGDPWIRARVASLQQGLDAVAARLGSLDVRASTPGAAVRVNGRSAGALPLARPLRTPVGSVVVEVTAEGFTPVTRTINVVADELTRETFDLVRVAPQVGVVQPQPDRQEMPQEAQVEADANGSSP